MLTQVVKNDKSQDVHRVLAHSYTVYFFLFLLGVCLDVLLQPKIFLSQDASFNLTFIGTLLLMLASVLIVWAQNTSRNLEKNHISKESFCRGPYCFTRSPTHWGLFILMIGFGILTNAIFVILTTIISFILTKTIFLKKEESILEEKYGTPYVEYKKTVKL
jgi:protein-S-isoprenylcysteine O-methyltransferase Ste14